MNKATSFITFICVMLVLAFQDSLPDPRVLITLFSLTIAGYILWKVISGISKNRSRASEEASRMGNLKVLDALVQAALADGTLELDEYNELIEKAEAKGLSKRDVDDIRRSYFEKESRPLLASIKENGSLSDQDFEALEDLAAKRGMVLDITPEVMAANIMWRIQYRDEWKPRVLNTDLLLGSGEEAYFCCPAQWAQQTVIRENLGYQGASVNVRVSSNISVGLGGAKPVFNEYETLKTIAEGTLYLTNKRLFFKSISTTHTIVLSKISDLDYFSDGLRVYKASGKPDVFIVINYSATSLKALLPELIAT